MPFTYHIDAASARTVVTYTGIIFDGELGDSVRTVYTDPAWQGGDAIWDFSAVGNRVVLLPEDIAYLTESADAVRAAQYPGHTIVVVTGENAEMVARLYGHVRRSSVRQFSIVHSRAEAEALLDGPEAS